MRNIDKLRLNQYTIHRLPVCGYYMKILDFVDLTNLNTRTEAERAKLLCFYHYNETDERQFSMTLISDLMQQFGFNIPNVSRLKDKLIKGKDKIFLPIKGSKGEYKFIPAILQGLEREYSHAWNDTETIVSDSELIEEIKFCGKRNSTTRLIQQINSSYKNHCYDACAVLMRRLFEVILILTYQNLNIDNEIKSNDKYIMLKDIVKNARQNKKLKLTLIKDEFDKFRDVGNYSAHSIDYTAGKKDIDDVKLKYRVMLEELYNKAGLIV